MMVFPLEEETVREITGVGRRVSLRMTSTAVPLADPFIPVAMLIKKKDRGANGRGGREEVRLYQHMPRHHGNARSGL